MSLRDLKIEKCYETKSLKTSLVDEFYIPALENSNLYLRIAGFFSSSSLAVVSKGLSGLLKNNGKMKLLISPELSESDYNVLKNKESLNEFDPLFKDFDIENFADDENLKLFAWMLANEKIEIKIVIDKNSKNSLFHQKIGIFIDGSDILSFSGSINETAQAWLNNIEEFKTFKSWDANQCEYLIPDLQKFNDYWDNNRKDIAMVFDIPNAIKDRIVKIKPRDVYDLNIMRRYKVDIHNKNNTLSLFEHQKNAVNMWLTNNKELLMEMATGTGKTRTAIGCILEQMKTKEPTVYLIATPQNTLSKQWRDDIEGLNIQFDINKIVDGSNKNWKKDLETILSDIMLGVRENAILFTSHDLCCKPDFINIIKSCKYNTKFMFVCDEVHAMGAEQQSNGLLEEYDYKVGLTATPERMFDDGTEIIRKYFGNKSFEFTIYDAMHTINPRTGHYFLNKYKYIPIFVDMTDEEMSKYRKYNKMIATEMSKDEPDYKKIEGWRMSRANITKNAFNKLKAYNDLIFSLNYTERLQDCITFVSPEQIDDVMSICSSQMITRAKITQAESATKVVNLDGDSERQDIIKKFSSTDIQVLVGIYCLDEGIDIPRARIAVLMSSSTNPREYVQRIGRVIRYAPNKPISLIFDLVVLGDNDGLNLKEARRSLMLAENAENYAEVIEKFNSKGVDTSCLLVTK